MKVLGLTGGIATGKSTVAALLRARGIEVIDADQVSREVVAPGTPGLQQLRDAFGGSVVQADGALDRSALRALVLADPQARRQLEAITHPLIHAEITTQLARLAGEGNAMAVVEAALMVETGSYRQYDAVIVVSCAPETQLSRLRSRNALDEETARAWIASQLPLADKEAIADVLIRNDGDQDALARAVDDALDRCPDQ